MKEEGYIDKRTPEEKRKEIRQCRQIAVKNEIVLKMLLDKNRK